MDQAGLRGPNPDRPGRRTAAGDADPPPVRAGHDDGPLATPCERHGSGAPTPLVCHEYPSRPAVRLTNSVTVGVDTPLNTW